jgi:hypothetical protein
LLADGTDARRILGESALIFCQLGLGFLQALEKERLLRPIPPDPELQRPAQRSVFFDRRELNLILWTYGRGVAEGEWRDYAMDALSDRALFSIYRRASESPLYQIEKRPDLAKKQGAFSIVGAGGTVLRRGHDLGQVLRFFDRKRFAVVAD